MLWLLGVVACSSLRISVFAVIGTWYSAGDLAVIGLGVVCFGLVWVLGLLVAWFVGCFDVVV